MYLGRQLLFNINKSISKILANASCEMLVLGIIPEEERRAGEDLEDRWREREETTG